MTEQQIIVTLATKVMGWERFFHDGMQLWGWKQDSPYYFTSHWNPFHNIADAWMIVEKFDDYKIGKDWCRLYRGDDKWFVWGFNTSREAICQAALKSVA
ncbi:BC1872 family protein [Brevibacillus borstelensis]|uniref:BC1872 family protein n=1 Tax=Brevibacillus borstelensis TaxID=45462 RepID=UPI0030C226FD